MTEKLSNFKIKKKIFSPSLKKLFVHKVFIASISKEIKKKSISRKFLKLSKSKLYVFLYQRYIF